jgi:formylmethanofuran dehydrogenase subunit E
MANISDNYDIWEAHEIEMERRRARRPKCYRCGEHIQDETAVEIAGKLICENCIDDLRVCLENYDEDF